ncbi:MAG: hypothetical protein JWM57_3224 [Phycisphaerales bacterium]|nr:hypothetical protein [Phycisphaerales bacterium]
MVRIHRVDGTGTDQIDTALIKRASKELVFGNGDRISDFADCDLRFGGSCDENHVQGVMVGLTDYSMEDEDGNEDMLIARDEPLAERFAEQLQEKLGLRFQVAAYAGHW